jgi:hypothetical protein
MLQLIVAYWLFLLVLMSLLVGVRFAFRVMWECTDDKQRKLRRLYRLLEALSLVAAGVCGTVLAWAFTFGGIIPSTWWLTDLLLGIPFPACLYFLLLSIVQEVIDVLVFWRTNQTSHV